MCDRESFVIMESEACAQGGAGSAGVLPGGWHPAWRASCLAAGALPGRWGEKARRQAFVLVLDHVNDRGPSAGEGPVKRGQQAVC